MPVFPQFRAVAYQQAARKYDRPVDESMAFFFEEWLWSDDWQGGGEHPVDMDDSIVFSNGRCIEMTPSGGNSGNE